MKCDFAVGSAAMWVVGLAGVLGGCASSVTKESRVGEPTSDFAVVGSSAPSSVVEAQRISERVAQRIEFVEWPSEGEIPSAAAAKASGARLIIVRERSDAPDGMESTPMMAQTSWVVRRYRTDLAGGAGGNGKLIRESRLVLTEGGSVALAQEKNNLEDVIVDFEPPLWVLPAKLPNGGEACVFESVKLTVHTQASPEKVKAQGKVQHTVCYEADETLNTPAGRFMAHRIVSRFDADLGASRVENVTTQWFARDLGIVAERRHEQTFALGVRIRNNEESWIAAKVEGDPDPKAE